MKFHLGKLILKDKTRQILKFIDKKHYSFIDDL